MDLLVALDGQGLFQFGADGVGAGLPVVGDRVVHGSEMEIRDVSNSSHESSRLAGRARRLDFRLRGERDRLVLIG